MKMKFSHVRKDTQPKRSEYQQTSRQIFPFVALWADGTEYHQVGLSVGWWKWSWMIFFIYKLT